MWYFVKYYVKLLRKIIFRYLMLLMGNNASNCHAVDCFNLEKILNGRDQDIDQFYEDEMHLSRKAYKISTQYSVLRTKKNVYTLPFANFFAKNITPIDHNIYQEGHTSYYDIQSAHECLYYSFIFMIELNHLYDYNNTYITLSIGDYDLMTIPYKKHITLKIPIYRTAFFNENCITITYHSNQEIIAPTVVLTGGVGTCTYFGQIPENLYVYTVINNKQIRSYNGKIVKINDYVPVPKEPVYPQNSQNPLISATAPPQELVHSEHLNCIICRTNAKTVLILPCKHLAFCNDCNKIYNDTSCPLCRGEITDRTPIYV